MEGAAAARKGAVQPRRMAAGGDSRLIALGGLPFCKWFRCWAVIVMLASCDTRGRARGPLARWIFSGKRLRTRSTKFVCMQPRGNVCIEFFRMPRQAVWSVSAYGRDVGT